MQADGTLAATRGPLELVGLVAQWAFLAVLGVIALFVIGGVVLGTGGGIIGAVAQRFLPVWIALIATFALSITFKRRLGLYGKLFDSTIGMVGFAIVMFWVFTAVCAALDLVATHGALQQISTLKNESPGAPMPEGEGGYPFYLLGGDNLGRDVFSRMVYGSLIVMQIAPFATLFAFMVGITLGLPAGYYGGKLDTFLSFLANLILAFPVILLFYLLVTPEIVATGIPVYMAGVLFFFPIVFLTILFNSRFHTQPTKRNVYLAVTLVIGLWLYAGIAWDADPLGLVSMPPNLLVVFVAVVFVNSPTVFRIVRGIVLDVKTRDYVAAGQTRGEGAWYIMLWEILPNAPRPADRRFLPPDRLHDDPPRHARLLRPGPVAGEPGLGEHDQRRAQAAVDLPASGDHAGAGADEPGAGAEPPRGWASGREPKGLMSATTRGQRMRGFRLFTGVSLAGLAFFAVVVLLVHFGFAGWLAMPVTQILFISLGVFSILVGNVIPALHAKDANESRRNQELAMIAIGLGTYIMGLASVIIIITT